MHAARREPARGPFEKPRLQQDELGDIALTPEIGQFRMAPDRAGRRARRIEEDGVEAAFWFPNQRIRHHEIGSEPKPGEIALEHTQARGRAIERRDLRTGCGKLRRLAAGCGAEIEHRAAATSPSSFTGNAAAWSCTHQAPSA